MKHLDFITNYAINVDFTTVNLAMVIYFLMELNIKIEYGVFIEALFRYKMESCFFGGKYIEIVDVE